MKNKDMIRDFFDKNILPLHLKVKSGELEYLDETFNSKEESYFSDPHRDQYHYLTSIASQNKVELESFLKIFWKDEPHLLNLIGDLIELAFILRENNNEQSSELSTSLYVMF